MKNKNRAFSLIELSIVILIIGILIAGVTQGSRLVGASRLQTAQTLTQSSPVASLSGLSLWLETSTERSFTESEVEDEGALTLWNDINPQVTNNLRFVASTNDVTYESNGINGLPSVEFSGAATQIGFIGDVTTSPSEFIVAPYSSYTFFIVHKVANKTAAQTLIYNGNEGVDGIGISTTTDGFISLDGAFTSVAGTDAFTDGAGQITVVTIAPNSVLGQYVATPAVHTYIDGQVDVNGTNIDAAIVTPSENFYIGNASGTANDAPLTGQISEIIVFDNVLKRADRESVEDYLAQKYSIAIAR